MNEKQKICANAVLDKRFRMELNKVIKNMGEKDFKLAEEYGVLLRKVSTEVFYDDKYQASRILATTMFFIDTILSMPVAFSKS